MAVTTTTIVSICANLVLGISGLALALLIAWQDARRRSSQYFALCMALFGLYGFLNALWQVPQQFEIEPEPLYYSLTTLYVVAATLLFKFIFAFGEVPRRVQQIEWEISIPLWAVFVVLLWLDELIVDFEPLSTGSYQYRLEPLGIAGSVIIAAYLLVSLGLLHYQREPKARELSVPVGLMTLGLAGFAAVPAAREVSFNAIMVTVAVLLLGRTVLNYRVFHPLADLNAQLAAANAQLAEATRLKSQFLANMSHELRTPLNSIIGYTELVANRTYGELTPLQEDRLLKVARNGRRLLELINDVLDLSKIEAGRLDLAPTTVPTGELLDDLLSELEPRAQNKGLMVVRGYGDLPPLCVDPARARQILWNLVTNAIKFTERGAVIVRGHYDPAQRQVEIIVTDTGRGIPPERQEIIFEAFIQANGALIREEEGTGLGLALARRLTEMHGGAIWFESTPGRGSSFHVTLPAAEEPQYATQVLAPKTRGSGPVVLAIDDDYEALEVIQDQLAAAGLRVYGACNPNDGLRLAHTLQPALITLDVMMPGMDGWQVLRALRQDPTTRLIPVLIVSAVPDEGTAKANGADGFVRKPVQPPELARRIRAILEHSAPGAARKRAR